MQIKFVDRSKQLPDAVREHGEHVLRLTLSRFGEEIRQVTVLTEDVNGPRGGLDKRCVIRAKLRQRGTVEVTQAGTEFGPCIGNAARRLGRSVRRQFDLQNRFERQSIRRGEGFWGQGLA